MKVIVATLVFLAAGYAHAAGGACKADHEKFCKDVKGGGGAIASCMKSHEAELSAACKADIAKRVADAEAVKGACKDDREKVCPGVEPGNGRIAACFEDNMSKVSMGCKAKLATHGKHFKEAHKACAADIKSQCGSAKSHADKFKCLQEHNDSLSAECKAAIDDVE